MAGDESFFRGETPLTHTWGDTKQRKLIKTSSHYGSIGVLGAVDPKDGEHFELVIDNGSIDSEVVNIFLHKLGEKYKNKNILLLLDKHINYVLTAIFSRFKSSRKCMENCQRGKV